MRISAIILGLSVVAIGVVFGQVGSAEPWAVLRAIDLAGSLGIASCGLALFVLALLNRLGA